jgi:hypothetical protein
VSRRPRQSTVPAAKPPRRVTQPRPPRLTHRRTMVPRRDVARLIDQGDASLVDVLDNLLNRGVVLNADLVLALANVDLVYVRLAALLCAADRLLPRGRR